MFAATWLKAGVRKVQNLISTSFQKQNNLCGHLK
jgi:hypothetical protein